jgi:hypothetical protein
MLGQNIIVAAYGRRYFYFMKYRKQGERERREEEREGETGDLVQPSRAPPLSELFLPVRPHLPGSMTFQNGTTNSTKCLKHEPLWDYSNHNRTKKQRKRESQSKA